MVDFLEAINDRPFNQLVGQEGGWYDAATHRSFLYCFGIDFCRMPDNLLCNMGKTGQGKKEMYGFEGGDLEGFYEKFKADFEKSEARAETVHKRIAAVEDVADGLFKEWQNEITQISNPRLRAESSHTPWGRRSGSMPVYARPCERLRRKSTLS